MGVMFHPGQFNQRYYPQSREHKQIPAPLMRHVCSHQWPQTRSCLISPCAGGSDLIWRSLLTFPSHYNQVSGQEALMWLGGLVQFCPGFPGHTFATSHDIHKKSVLIKGLTCGHHLGKEPRRSLRGSTGGHFRCPPAQKPGPGHATPGWSLAILARHGCSEPAAGSQVAGPGHASARHIHGRMSGKLCRQQLSESVAKVLTLINPLLSLTCQGRRKRRIFSWYFPRCKPEFLVMFSVLVIRYFRYDVTIRQWLHHCSSARPGP